jgi:hypothetical protein
LKTLFKDINLKFAVISCLNEFGLYIDEAEKIKLNLYGRNSFDKLSYDDIVPEVNTYYKGLEIDKSDLEKVIQFNPSTSNTCYNLLVKEWSGEDDIFDIKSLDGIENLISMEIFNPYGLMNYNVDIKALLKCKNLKIVHQKFIPQTNSIKSVVEKLRIKGIEIVE